MATGCIPCRTCGAQFIHNRAGERGRPQVICDECRAKRARSEAQKKRKRLEIARGPCEGCAACDERLTLGLCPKCADESARAIKAYRKRRHHGRSDLPPVLIRRASATAITKTMHRCIVCGSSFYPGRTDRTKCCGRECGTAFSGMQAKAEKNGGRVWVRRNRKRCPSCGKMHGRRGPLCSDGCSRAIQIYRYTPVVVSSCRECRVEFDRRTEGASRYFCSADCSDKSSARSKRATRKARDALERGASGADRIDPLAVFDRDGWKCKLCGRKTPKQLRGTYKPRAPELDHIMPLSKGGLHSLANVQCACRECNGLKGATPKGQLMLFPGL